MRISVVCVRGYVWGKGLPIILIDHAHAFVPSGNLYVIAWCWFCSSPLGQAVMAGTYGIAPGGFDINGAHFEHYYLLGDAIYPKCAFIAKAPKGEVGLSPAQCELKGS